MWKVFVPRPGYRQARQRRATDGCFNPVGGSPKPFLRFPKGSLRIENEAKNNNPENEELFVYAPLMC